jgi:probable HAF family extracellular repeat protein
MRDLGTLGGAYSSAHAVNSAGQVAGTSLTTSYAAYHAFRYDGTPGAGGVMRDLGTFGGTPSRGRGINDAGQVVGWSDASDGGKYPFRCDGIPGAGGVLRNLGPMVDAFAINNARDVVGYGYTSSGLQRAFLCTGTPDADGVAIDLDAWLDTNNPTGGDKWTLIEANGINDTGLITGAGDYYDGPGGLNDGRRAFILDASSLVPEPTATWLLVLAAAPRARCRSRLRTFK